MKHSIYIDQLVYSHWEGKIDAGDCIIMAFIQQLDRNNPEIAKRMWRNYFLCMHSWILEQIPILNIGKRQLRRKLKKLNELGILDVKVRVGVNENGELKSRPYYKLSKLFYRIHNARHKAVDEALKKATENSEKNDASSWRTHMSQPQDIKGHQCIHKNAMKQEREVNLDDSLPTPEERKEVAREAKEVREDFEKRNKDIGR